MKLDTAIAVFKNLDNYREVQHKGETHYLADVNGWTIGFWKHCTSPGEISAVILGRQGDTDLDKQFSFTGKALTTTIKWCRENKPGDPPKPKPEQQAKDVRAIQDLRLVTVYVDGDTSLCSLAHRCVIFTGGDGEHPQDYLPHVHLTEEIEQKAGKLFYGNDYDPETGFPGWGAILHYIDRNPKVLNYPKRAKVQA